MVDAMANAAADKTIRLISLLPILATSSACLWTSRSTLSGHSGQGNACRRVSLGLNGREDTVNFQRAYPEPWGVLIVKRVVADAEWAAVEAMVVDPEGRVFALAAFWPARQGLLDRGVEYWVDVAARSPPAGRASSAATEAARRAWTPSDGPTGTATREDR
jgi:hypothetical protein